MISRSLRIRCPTWSHVENFYAVKVKAGNLLTARVPFSPEPGSEISLALELPDNLVIDIGGKVRSVAPAADGKKTSVKLELVGLTEQLRARLEVLVAEAKRSEPSSAEAQRPPQPRAKRAKRPSAPPAPLPADAPVDELVEPPPTPRAEDVPEAHRPVFQSLKEELRRLRQCSAHDVLGVTWDASVHEIRQGYFSLVKRFHPDVYARHHSASIAYLASEVLIHINKAYDRMRDAAVAAGDAMVAGPALLPHEGWFAEFDDIGTIRSEQPTPREQVDKVRRSPDQRAARGSQSPPPSVRFERRSAPATGTGPDRALSADRLFGDMNLDAETGAAGAERKAGAGKLVESARRHLEDGDFDRALEIFAEALQREPRDRSLRALYHVAYGRSLVARGNPVEAMTQFEAALAHDSECREARRAIDESGQRGKKSGLLRRLFSR